MKSFRPLLFELSQKNDGGGRSLSATSVGIGLKYKGLLKYFVTLYIFLQLKHKCERRYFIFWIWILTIISNKWMIVDTTFKGCLLPDHMSANSSLKDLSHNFLPFLFYTLSQRTAIVVNWSCHFINGGLLEGHLELSTFSVRKI